MANSYEIPSWAGKPSNGLHLDILKEDKFLVKVMIDDKKCYYFGRNTELNDFRIDHASCSRVHAALIYHKFLNLNFLVDLGSTHGTFIGTLRLEAHKPTVVQIGASFHFGASTRNYILRERVKTQNIVEDLPGSAETVLPENEEEVNQITEYNTAHNRKISTLGITENIVVKKGLKRKQVHFNDDEIIINPEDIDPTIGRFRNLVQSTVIPMSSKKMRLDNSGNFGLNTASSASSSSTEQKHILHHPIMSAPATVGLYSGLCEPEISKFLLPNPAPEIDSIKVSSSSQIQFKHNDDDYSIGDYDPEPRKKKYKKETWHGAKKPVKAFGDI